MTFMFISCKLLIKVKILNHSPSFLLPYLQLPNRTVNGHHVLMTHTGLANHIIFIILVRSWQVENKCPYKAVSMTDSTQLIHSILELCNR